MNSETTVSCFCIWSDLLGFGSAFQEGDWSFGNAQARKNIERLRILESSLYTSNDPRKEVALVLNDGLARVYDLPTPGQQATEFLWWLHSALSNHWSVNAADAQRKWPGMRSVISFGERVVSLPNQKTWGDHFLGNTELKRIADHKVCIYSPAEFQLNLAFSKAYIIESYGSKAGLAGPGLFIDEAALNAIQKYLTGTSFDFIRHTDTTEIPGGGVLNFEVIQVAYAVQLRESDEHFLFEVVRKEPQQNFLMIAIEFESKPIEFSERGIRTRLFKVKRYKPIDEQEPFYFDFENYAFHQQNT